MVGRKEWDSRASVFAFFFSFFLGGGSFVLVGSQDVVVAGSWRLLGVHVQHCPVLRNCSGGFSGLSMSRTSSFILCLQSVFLGSAAVGPWPALALGLDGLWIRWTSDQTFAAHGGFSSELIFVLWAPSELLSVVFFSRSSLQSIRGCRCPEVCCVVSSTGGCCSSGFNCPAVLQDVLCRTTFVVMFRPKGL